MKIVADPPSPQDLRIYQQYIHRLGSKFLLFHPYSTFYLTEHSGLDLYLTIELPWSSFFSMWPHRLLYKPGGSQPLSGDLMTGPVRIFVYLVRVMYPPVIRLRVTCSLSRGGIIFHWISGPIARRGSRFSPP